MKEWLTPSGIYLEPLADEQIPDSPPDAPMRWGSEVDLSLYANGSITMFSQISFPLLRSAWRLVEIAQQSQGRYADGCALPASSVAASTGAIAIGCAALEAALNEQMYVVGGHLVTVGKSAEARVMELGMKLSVRERMDLYGGVLGQAIDWGSDPFQSLLLIMSVRKHLLHHESYNYLPLDGEWPSKQLRELPRRIRSPYATTPDENSSPHRWDTHILTPRGAEWAVRTVINIVGWIEFVDPSYQRRSEDSVVDA